MALHVLAHHFGMREHWQTAVDFLLREPAHTRRIAGANALGSLKRNTQDRPTLHVLARVVRNALEEDEVRAAANAAMSGIWAFDQEEQYRLMEWDWEEKADWSFVHAFLNGADEP